MLDWMRTRSKRDLALAIAVAVCSVLVIGTFVFARTDDRVEHEFRHVVEHRVERRVENRDRRSGGEIAAFDATFEAGSARGLQVSLGEVDVAVSATDADEARVILWVEDEGDWSERSLERMGFRVEVEGGVLRVWDESNDRGWDHDADDYDMRLEVTAPRNFDIQLQTGDGDVAVGEFTGSVEVRTGDGDIAIGGAAGQVRIQTGDGDVALGDASGGDVRIQTGDGDVVTGRLEVGDFEVRTGDGDILVEELSGRLTATTGDGDVQVTLARFEGLQIRTGDGDVTIYASPSLSADIEFIGTEFLLGDAFALPAVFDTRTLEGALNGGGPELSVRVGDGTVRLLER